MRGRATGREREADNQLFPVFIVSQVVLWIRPEVWIHMDPVDRSRDSDFVHGTLPVTSVAHYESTALNA